MHLQEVLNENSCNGRSQLYRLPSGKKLLERGDEVVGIYNINDYYDVNLKYGRLKELGITQKEIEEGKTLVSSFFPKHKFIKLDLSDKEGMDTLFEHEKFDAV